MAPLLPKLRGHFAEFLNKGFSARLRILSSPTCVGLRYGRQYANSGFSWQYGFGSFSTYFRSASHVRLHEKRICLLLILGVCTPHQPGATLILLRPHIFIAFAGTGISTCCPSTTPFGLALGPDLPWEDEPCSGILGLSTGMILTSLFATHASILTCI